MESLQTQLFSLRDAGYAAFIARLTPSVSPASIIGVRTPQLRALAKELVNANTAPALLDTAPHVYYEENMLHAILIDLVFCQYDDAIARTEAFLPYVDNWAVCDALRPRAFQAQHVALASRVSGWLGSSRPYTVRFGAVMLMRHFLEADFSLPLLEQAVCIRSEKYYINMALAWLLCEALIKQYDSTLPIFQQGAASPWVHNKAIQKAVESCRLSEETKARLRSLRR